VSILYSTQLGVSADASTSPTFGPWPGKRVVVLDVEWGYPGGSPGDGATLIDTGSGSLFGGFVTSTGTQDILRRPCKVAITDGGTITAESTIATTVIITGWLLDLP
jgi:hypothetical protein